MKISKKALLFAIRSIREEYVTDTHETKIDKCGLCLMFYNPYSVMFGEVSECGKCPMTIFYKQLGCLHRNIRAFGSKYINEYAPERKELLIKFYDEFIERVRGMNSKQLNAPNAFDFLVEIDAKIYDDYGETNYKLMIETMNKRYN